MSISFLLILLLILVCCVIAYILTTKLKPGDTYGDASFGEWPDQLVKEKENLPAGFVLGKDEKDNYAVWTKEGHWLTVAPTGAGKSTGIIIPTINNWQNSLMAIDIKGELVTACEETLHKQGINTYCIDPFNITNNLKYTEKISIDAFQFVKSSEDKVAAINKLANILIDPPSHGDAHWAESARVVLSGLLAVISSDPKLSYHIGIAEINKLIYMKMDDLLDYFEGEKNEDVKPIIDKSIEIISNTGVNERGAILSTINRQIHFLLNKNIIESLSGGNTLEALLNNEKKNAVFVVIPANQLDTQARFLRLITGIFIELILQAGSNRERKFLLAIDEASALGRLEVIEKGIGLFRGFGAQFLLSFQDLNQLNSTYGKNIANSIKANCHSIYWSTQELETCEYISKMLGDTTAIAKMRETTKIPVSKSGESRQIETKKPLLSPDQIRTLPKENMICFSLNNKPVKLDLIKYNEF